MQINQCAFAKLVRRTVLNHLALIFLPPVEVLGSFSRVASKILNLVVTCSARKTVAPRRTTRARILKSDTLPERFNEWIRNLTQSGEQPVSAQSLYAGASWVAIRQSVSEWKQPQEIKLWVISAGHGLVSGNTLIEPYAATFCPRHADFVLSKGGDLQSWWNHLIRWRRASNRSKPASIEAIAKAHRNSPLVVTISADYLKAVQVDLCAARSALRNPSQLVVICSGGTKKGELKDNFLPCDSRLEHVLGRGRNALNARILGRILATQSFDSIDAEKLKRKYALLLSDCPISTYPKRHRQSDESIIQFIHEQLIRAPFASHSKLLEEFRRAGKACEQSRFRKLFKRVNG